MRAACKGFRVLVGLGRSGSDAEIEKYETLLKTSQNLQKRTHEPSQARYSCHPVENQKSHLRVNLYVTITGGLQFFAIIISVKHTMQRLQSGLELIWAIVWDGEMVRCRAEWREALKLVSGVGCNLPWQLHHKVFFYLSCGAMLPTVWHFISFQFLWSNKQISLFTFQVPTLSWSINPTHCVGAYSSLIINSIHVFIREACRLQNQSWESFY